MTTNEERPAYDPAKKAVDELLEPPALSWLERSPETWSAILAMPLGVDGYRCRVSPQSDFSNLEIDQYRLPAHETGLCIDLDRLQDTDSGTM